MDRIKLNEGRLSDALFRIAESGRAILQASRAGDASSVAFGLKGWRQYLQDAEHAVEELGWRHECHRFL